jgi:hypothetical protein
VLQVRRLSGTRIDASGHANLSQEVAEAVEVEATEVMGERLLSIEWLT